MRRVQEVAVTPHMFVIDPSGILVYKGGIDDKRSVRWSLVKGATNYVRAALRSLWDGRSVAVSVSQPYGCSVKY